MWIQNYQADRLQIGNEIFEFGRKIGERNLVAMLDEKIVPEKCCLWQIIIKSQNIVIV